jgi:hypothetical protein
MLVSDIIANGQNIADVPNTTFYTPAEALTDAQYAWADVYAFLTANNDDYFATELYIPFASLTADSNRTNMYTYALPSDFYRLRILQYGNVNGTMAWNPCYKMTTEDYGRTQNAPAYKMIGVNLKIYDPMKYPTYYMLYYPAPANITTATDLAYPNNMIPQIMSYQIAIEIRRKQKLPLEDYIARRDELKKTMISQLPRDDFKAEKPKNEFAQGFNAYI